MTLPCELTGKKFGRWSILSRAGNSKAGKAMWYCRCDCGTERDVIAGNLVFGVTTSCGCSSRESASTRAIARNTKHGEAHRRQFSAEYKTWIGMKGRCKHQSVNGYEYYGGRGIKVCDRWLRRVP